jgi:tetratricopeptide (TPR) repeat protein
VSLSSDGAILGRQIRAITLNTTIFQYVEKFSTASLAWKENSEVSNWNEFPYDTSAFDFDGPALKKSWKLLHAGDGEPFPADENLQQAWRLFHRGDFQAAVQLADKLGLLAHAVANKATGIYASYLEDNEKRQIDCFKAAIERAEKATDAYPDDPNSHYFHAFNLGRYSQSISVVKALKQGVGGKISQSRNHRQSWQNAGLCDLWGQRERSLVPF